MFRKAFCMMVLSITLTNTAGPARFSVTAKSNQREDIEQMYTYKNEIIKKYQEMITGMEEAEVMQDLTLLYPNMTYENNCISLVIDEGEGKTIQGQLKKDYCEVDVKPKSYLAELFK